MYLNTHIYVYIGRFLLNLIPSKLGSFVNRSPQTNYNGNLLQIVRSPPYICRHLNVYVYIDIYIQVYVYVYIYIYTSRILLDQFLSKLGSFTNSSFQKYYHETFLPIAHSPPYIPTYLYIHISICICICICMY